MTIFSSCSRGTSGVGGRVERRAEQGSELTCHALGSHRVVRDQRGNGIERVEQKVRLDTRFERGELRFGRQPACFRFVTFLRAERQSGLLQPASQNLARGDENPDGQRHDDGNFEGAVEPRA